ncbi:glycosyltransferase 87 family protein [bacterium]|nr:glycosyltransferase 87 family protein [bacterium]
MSWLQRFFREQKFEEKLPRREILVVGLVFGAVFRITMLVTTPSLSDDIYRYIWDGKVANAGINPYKYTPKADTLRALQDPEHYPKINHKEISTIYPPVSQLIFTGVYKLNPSIWAFKVAFLMFEMLTIGVLLLILRRLRMNPNRALIFVWNPLVIIEFAGSGHADIIGIFFMSAGLWLLVEKRLQWSNVMIVLSFLTKFITILFLPILTYLKKQNRILIVLVFIIFTAVFYLPYASAGAGLFSGLLVYTSKWQFNGSIFSVCLAAIESSLPQRWVIDWMIVPQGQQADPATLATRTLDLALTITKVIVGLIFGWVFLYYLKRLGKDLRREGRRWLFRLGMILFALFFVLNPTVQPWYLCWLLPFLVVTPNRALILLTGLVALSYWILITYSNTGEWQETNWVKWAEYLPFYLVLAFDFVTNRIRERKTV